MSLRTKLSASIFSYRDSLPALKSPAFSASMAHPAAVAGGQGQIDALRLMRWYSTARRRLR